MALVPRALTSSLEEALADTPVVFVAGARQTGKSTLVQALATSHPREEWPYLTMDDLGVLSAARTDPKGFVNGLPQRVVIDEVQRAPEIFLPIKQSVDANRAPGRFLLTGSANVLAIPKISESLAGRMEIHTLWPFAQVEIEQREAAFLRRLLEQDRRTRWGKGVSCSDITQRMELGGLPEVLTRKSGRRRNAWFSSYLSTIVQRDIKDLSSIEGVAQVPRLLGLLATRCANLVNLSDLSRSLQVSHTSLARYMGLLEATFLVYRIPPWSANLGNRLVKTPKTYVTDTGLLCHLLGQTGISLASNRTLAGQVLENFVAGEVARLCSWHEPRPRLYHLRTAKGVEVDLVVELPGGQCAGIEVKLSETVSGEDAKGLRWLSEALGRRFIRGVVLYTGQDTIPLADNIHAVSVSHLWL